MKKKINPTKDLLGLNSGSEHTPSDLTIIARVQQGDRAAFAYLVRKYQKPLLRLALRIVRDLETAEDVVQESFLKAYQKLHLFEGRAAFRSWLFQIGINTAKNKMRGQRHEGIVDLAKVQISVAAQAETGLECVDLKEELNAIIEELPARQKLALLLRVYEDLSFKEIADIMECPYDTAKANYRHALLKLKNKIQDKKLLNLFNKTDFISTFGFANSNEGIEQ